jgi:hypothetical protein
MTPNLAVVLAVLPGIVVGLLLPLAIVGLVAYGIVELVRAGSDRPADGEGNGTEAGRPSAPTSPAIAILDERFARGEIDTDDYLQRRELLLASLGTVADGLPDHAADTSSSPTTGDSTATAEVIPTATATPAATVTTAPPADDAAGEPPSTGEQPPVSG